jgi:hypothetical protein
MRNFLLPRVLLVPTLLVAFHGQPEMAVAVESGLQAPQTILAVAPGLQIASAPEIARVPAAIPEPRRDADASPASENVSASVATERLKANEARAMIAALMALASSGGGRPFPLLPH